MNGDQTTDSELSESAWVELCLKHAATGSELDLTRDGAGDNPAEADAWPPGRRIPANAIRAALLELQRKPETADPRGLRIRGADIQGRLDLDYMQVPCPLHLVSCRMANGVSLREGRLPALSFNRSLLASSDQAIAAMQASGVTIAGRLKLRGATLTNEGGIALSLDEADIEGGAFLGGGFTASGEVRALGSAITGALVVRGATLTNKGGIALNLDGITVGGAAFLDWGFTAIGEVRGLGATIRGQLSLRGATLTNEGGAALSLYGANIGGDAFLDGGFTATGEVRASGATITVQLSLRGATLTNEGGIALRLVGARLARLQLQGLKKVEGGVDLTACEIGDLVLNDTKALPPGGLTAHGWRVRALHGAIATDASVALKWLDTLPKGAPYSPQPARELADVYDRTGHPDQARKLRRKTAWKVAKNAPRRSKPGHYLYGLVVGHGYSPMLPLLWITAFFAVALLLTSLGGSLFTPTEPVKAQAAVAAAASGTQTSPAPGPPATPPAPPIPNGATSCDELGGYPCFVPWTYALETVVPPAAAIQANAWQPAGWMMLAITALKASGWILVTLLLAGATGLLRRA